MSDPRGFVLTGQMMKDLDCDNISVWMDVVSDCININVEKDRQILGVVQITMAEYEDLDCNLGDLIVERFEPDEDMEEEFKDLLSALEADTLEQIVESTAIEETDDV